MSFGKQEPQPDLPSGEERYTPITFDEAVRTRSLRLGATSFKDISILWEKACDVIDQFKSKNGSGDVAFEKQIPNRQWCDMCGGLCRIIFWIPDDMWLECIPKQHWTSRVCIECFMERADEKFLPWDKHIKIISLDSFYSQREVQQRVEKGDYN